MSWEPWKEFNRAPEVNLPIEEPPCKHCKHWKPKAKYSQTNTYKYIFNGVICCHSDEMFHDFSCYEERT